MATERHLLADTLGGYELLDSGANEKLERWGEVVVRRPDTQAIWSPQNPAAWKSANASFAFKGGKGTWEIASEVPETWDATIAGLTLGLKLTQFKHTGVFPEQAPNWAWATEKITALEKPEVLNLFGYTGAASVAAAKAGASVTHADSSKAATTWARENAERNGITDGIRYIVEDARSFVKRELRRGAKYDGILLDPPAFGRGAKDEVWKIEEDLLPLMEDLRELLKEDPGSFLLLNGYAAGYAPLSFVNLVQSVFPGVTAEYGELRIKETTGRELPTGMYVRFVR